MTTPYIGYGFGRATRKARIEIRRRDSTIARFWHHRLTRDQYEGGYKRPTTDDLGPWRQTGHLHCFSRYGHYSDDVAWWAVALGFIYDEANGGGFTPEGMDHAMSLAVNDHDDVAQLVWRDWYAVPPFVRRHIGTRDDVADLIFDFPRFKREEGYT